MILNLTNQVGKKQYLVEKIVVMGLLDKVQEIKEQFLIELDMKKTGDNLIIEFKVLEYYEFNNKTLQQMFFNLMRNMTLEFDMYGKCLKCLNIEKIMSEWKKVSEKMIEGLNNPKSSSENELRKIGNFLKDKKTIKSVLDIYLIFFPPFYGVEIKDKYIYKEEIETFCGIIDMPVKIELLLENRIDSMYIRTKSQIDNVYFKENILKDSLRNLEIKWNTKEKPFISYYDYKLHLNKNDYSLIKGETKVGGEIEGIMSNYVNLSIKEVSNGG